MLKDEPEVLNFPRISGDVREITVVFNVAITEIH